MKPKSIQQRAHYAAKRLGVPRGTVQWTWFCIGFEKGVLAVKRQKKRFL